MVKGHCSHQPQQQAAGWAAIAGKDHEVGYAKIRQARPLPQEQPLGPVQDPQGPALPLLQVLHSQLSPHWQLAPGKAI